MREFDVLKPRFHTWEAREVQKGHGGPGNLPLAAKPRTLDTGLWVYGFMGFWVYGFMGL